MTEETAPLADLEIGLSFAQAAALVKEIDALWSNSNVHGKKKVKELRTLRETLAAEVERTS